ncbi:MAG: SDR family oxidoreductase [Bacteroidales bacterium]|nr:SDR family oxidoreductase [Bacteroidales bacterium]
MKKILITGSNGLLGQKLVALISENKNYQLIATSKSFNKIKNEGNYIFELMDITNYSEVNYILQNYYPDVVINTAAITNVDQCEENKTECWQVNVEAVKNLVEVSNKIKSHFIHLSTDFVFDGVKGLYKENDIPAPVSYYGYSKYEAEKIVQNCSDKWSIIRTVLVYGITNDMSRSNIVLWVKNSLENGKKIRVVDDQYRTPTLAEDLAKACFEVAKRNKEGIFHVSGTDYLSIIEIAYIIAEYFNLDKSLISPVASIELSQKGRRPCKTGFDIQKAIRELDFQPLSFKNGLSFIEEQLSDL